MTHQQYQKCLVRTQIECWRLGLMDQLPVPRTVAGTKLLKRVFKGWKK